MSISARGHIALLDAFRPEEHLLLTTELSHLLEVANFAAFIVLDVALRHIDFLMEAC